MPDGNGKFDNFKNIYATTGEGNFFIACPQVFKVIFVKFLLKDEIAIR